MKTSLVVLGSMIMVLAPECARAQVAGSWKWVKTSEIKQTLPVEVNPTSPDPFGRSYARVGGMVAPRKVKLRGSSSSREGFIQAEGGGEQTEYELWEFSFFPDDESAVLEPGQEPQLPTNVRPWAKHSFTLGEIAGRVVLETGSLGGFAGGAVQGSTTLRSNIDLAGQVNVNTETRSPQGRASATTTLPSGASVTFGPVTFTFELNLNDGAYAIPPNAPTSGQTGKVFVQRYWYELKAVGVASVMAWGSSPLPTSPNWLSRSGKSLSEIEFANEFDKELGVDSP